MKRRPVALTIYANDQDAYLEMLEAEQHAIDDALTTLDDDGFIKLHKESFTSSNRLIELAIRYHGRIILLHYAGHASGTQLSLKGGGGHQKGLAQLLKGIPFVFLNGCASNGHVEALLDNGVKAVIATSVAIGDSKALEFSSHLYQMLAKGHTLGEAFDMAKQGLELKHGEKTPSVGRGLKIRRNQEKNVFEWGLYTAQENIYNWKLPNEVYYSELEKVKDFNNEHLLKPNRYLVKNIYKQIRKYSDAAQRIRLERQNIQPKPNFSEGVQVIGESYLTPISEELRRLFTPERSKSFDVKRLKQILSVYQRTIKLLSYILLSQIWRDIRRLKLTEEDRQKIQVFFELDEYTYPSFDDYEFIRFLKNLLDKNKETYYMPEMAELDTNDDSEFSKSVFFLTELQDEIHAIQAELVEKTCQKAEEKLTQVLKDLYFLVKYKLLVVKRINILRIKNQSPIYLHDIIMLDNNKNNTQPDGTMVFEPYTDSDAVILFKEKANQGLNLAPFVIDQNALRKEDNSRIHYYSHLSAQNNLCYSSITDRMILEIDVNDDDDFDDGETNPYQVVAQQINYAKNDLLGLKAEVISSDDDFEEDDWDDD